MNDIGTLECSTSSVTLRPVVKHLCEGGEVLLVKTLGNIGEVDLRVFEDFLRYSKRSAGKKILPFRGLWVAHLPA